jgi:uncharacterized protein (TIGR02246 family)
VKRWCQPLVAALVGIGAVGTAEAQSTAALPGARDDSVHLVSMVREYVDATRHQDTAKELANYSEDATFLTTAGRYMVGKKALKAFYRRLVGTTDSIHYRAGTPVVRMLDSQHALVYYTWKVEWYRTGQPSNLDDVGMMTISAQKRNRRWYWVAVTSQRLPAFFDSILDP